MKFVRLSVAPDGETRFQNDELAMDEADYRPPAPLLFVSRARESSMIQFVRLPAGWEGKSFTVPEPQFFICVEGALEISASDGESRTFGPGSVVLMEDTSGKGHSTRVVGNHDAIAALAPVLD